MLLFLCGSGLCSPVEGTKRVNLVSALDELTVGAGGCGERVADSGSPSRAAERLGRRAGTRQCAIGWGQAWQILPGISG